jgi:hypothetical protein
MSEGQKHAHHLNCYIDRGKQTGIYIGKLKEIPGIVVYSKNKDEIIEKIHEAVSAYFDAFPKQHDIIFKEPDMDECVQKIPVEI